MHYALCIICMYVYMIKMAFLSKQLLKDIGSSRGEQYASDKAHLNPFCAQRENVEQKVFKLRSEDAYETTLRKRTHPY